MATDKTNAGGNNLLIVMVLVSLLVVGATGVLVKLMVSNIIRDAKVVTAKDKADKQLKEDVAAAPQLVSSFQSLGSQAATLADALPTSIDFPSLIVTVENMSTDAGLSVKGVTSLLASSVSSSSTGAAAATATPVPRPYGFSLTYEGSFAALQKFLTDVETSARPMRVVGMQNSGSGNSVSGEIDLQTYYQDKATLPITKEQLK